MKRLLINIFFMVFCTPSVLWAQKCYDYDCNMTKARTALDKKQFKEALAYCKAAKAYPNANISEADALVDIVFEKIEAEKQAAIEQKKRAEDATKKANDAAEVALKAQNEAQEATKRAEIEATNAKREKQIADKGTRAAENAATFMNLRGVDSTLAMRMMYYNYVHHPENKFTRDIYHQTIHQQTAFYTHLLRGENIQKQAFAFSPDGAKMALGTNDGLLLIWDLKNRQGEKVPLGYAGVIRTITFSSDGKKIATGSSEGLAMVWDVATGKTDRIFNVATSYVFSLAFSSDNKKLLTGSTHGMTILWDIESGQPEKYFVNSGYSYTRVWAVAFSPDNKKILTGGYNGKVILWDVATGKIENTFMGHKGEITSITFSPNGDKILTGSEDRTAKLWDISTRKLEKTFEDSLNTYTATVNTVAFSKDGKKVLLGSRYGKVKLWDIEKRALEQVFEGDVNGVDALIFSPEAKRIATSRTDGTIMIWDGFSDDKTDVFVKDKEPIAAFAYSPDEKVLVTGGDDFVVKIWDAQTGQLLKKLMNYKAAVHSVAFSPDGKKLMTCSKDDTLRLWDRTTGHLDWAIDWDSTSTRSKRGSHFTNLSKPVAVFSPDGKTLLTSGSDFTAELWDSQNGQHLKTFTGHYSCVTSAAFSPNGKQVVTGNLDNNAIIWDVESGKIVHNLRAHTFAVNTVAFSPDGKYVATGSGDKTSIVWDVANGKVLNTFIGHRNDIRAIAFTKDGKKILTGSGDGSAKLWDVQLGIAEKTFMGHTEGVNAVAFSQSGKKIITANQDNTIRIWDIATDAIEDKSYAFSIYQLAKSGLIIEPQDTPQYLTDSIADMQLLVKHLEWRSSSSFKESHNRFYEVMNSTSKLPYKATIDSLIKVSEARQAEENAQLVAIEEARKKQAASEKEKTDPLGYLKDKIDNEADTAQQYKLYGILIDTLKKRWQVAPGDYATELADAYNSRAYLGFFLNKYKESENNIRAGIQIDESNSFLWTNLPLSLLLQGKFEEAKAEYTRLMDKKLNLSGFDTYRDAFLEDLTSLEKEGVIPKSRLKNVADIKDLLEKKE